jgi:hypothetical protein
VAIAHGSEILGASNAVAGNYDTAITPAATPNGVCVIIIQNAAVTDVVTSVAYGTGAGSVPLSRAASPYGFATIGAEAGAVYIYWAGDSAAFPSGLQTVRIARTGTTAIRAAIATMTCAVGQVVAVDTGATLSNASSANPAWTMTTTVTETQCYLGLHSGNNALTGTPAANWTLAPTPGFVDLGTQGIGWARRFFSTGPGNAAPGWTVAAASWVGAAIAFKEAPPPPPMGKKWKGLPVGTRRAQTAVHQASSW